MEFAAHLIRVIIIALLALGFLLFGWRDFLMLFRRPTARMGTGLSRIWAVARVAMLEVRAGRGWILILLFLIASSVIILGVRPFDESERIPIYIRVLLTAQEIILMVGFWVFACISFPKEREKKLLVTNATKPVSRFELMLGKITGFTVAGGLMLLVMAVLSYGILVISNKNLKDRAAAEYQRAEDDYRTQMVQAGNDKPLPPQPGLKTLSREGSLHAYNYVTPRRGGFSVVGFVDMSTIPPTRYLKGGSQEMAVFTLPHGIFIPPDAGLQPPGQRPTLIFRFPPMPYMENPPKVMQIHVTVTRVLQPLDEEDKTLTLGLVDGRPDQAFWEIDDPEKFFGTGPDDDRGPVQVTVGSPTSGYFFKIFDGALPDASGATDADFNVYFAPSINQITEVVPCLPNPVVEGFQSRGTQQVSGPDYSTLARGETATALECGIFHFSGEDLAHVPVVDGKFTLSLFFDIDKQKNEDMDTQAKVWVTSMASPADTYKQDITVVEKRKTEITIPESYLGGSDPKKRQDLYIRVFCTTPAHWMGATDQSARIESPESYFFVNLLKSELTLFGELLLWIAVCVVCSIRLDWPMAMLTSSCVYCLGHIAEFVAGLPDYGGLAALNLSPYGNHGATWRFFDSVMMYIWQTLNVLVHLMPNFTRYDAQAFITDLRNRPWMAVGDDLMVSCIYALPFLVIGFMTFRKQEIG